LPGSTRRIYLEVTMEPQKFNAPFNTEIAIEEKPYDEGMSLLHVRIRQRTRFTDVELDPETAAKWGRILLDWADSQKG
jgi:hypothetical protein